MKLYESDLDDLWEAYYAAVGELDGEQGDLREKIIRALDWINRHRKLRAAETGDAFEAEVVRRLYRVVEAGARVKTLSRGQLRTLAEDVRGAERHLHEGLTARAQEFWEQSA